MRQTLNETSESSGPSYLGLLNAIAVGERDTGELLCAWRDATPDPVLAELLNVIAIREHEHAAAFGKRLSELGFAVRPPADTDRDAFDAQLALARSDKSDTKKFRRLLGYGRKRNRAKRDRARPDRLQGLLADPTIDPDTGALLGRYIAEQRDSERRLRAAYARQLGEPSVTYQEELELRDIVERLDRLSASLEHLRRLRDRC